MCTLFGKLKIYSLVLLVPTPISELNMFLCISLGVNTTNQLLLIWIWKRFIPSNQNKRKTKNYKNRISYLYNEILKHVIISHKTT